MSPVDEGWWVFNVTSCRDAASRSAKPGSVALPDGYPLPIPEGFTPVCAVTITHPDARQHLVELWGPAESVYGAGLSEAIPNIVAFYHEAMDFAGYSPTRAEGLVYGTAADFSGNVAVAVTEHWDGEGVAVLTMWETGLIAEYGPVPPNVPFCEE